MQQLFEVCSSKAHFIFFLSQDLRLVKGADLSDVELLNKNLPKQPNAQKWKGDGKLVPVRLICPSFKSNYCEYLHIKFSVKFLHFLSIFFLAFS